jgi:hypothetical protein
MMLLGAKEFKMRMRLISLFMALAYVLSAQPTPTKVYSHRLGETLQEWLAENQMDLAAICASKKRDDKTVCKTLSLYRDGKTGTFETIDDKKHRYEWLFIDGNVAEATTGAALDFYAGGSHFAASNMDEQIGFLSQVYGPPAKVQTVPYQNALGAKWNCVEATWNMPDGAVIIATESITMMDAGPDRSIKVRFISKERVIQLQQSKPNPYIH